MIDDRRSAVWAREVRRTSAQQGLLRLLVFIAPLGVLVAGDQASATSPSSGLVVLVVLLAAGATASPDSHAGLLVLVVLAMYWSAAVDDPGTPWSLFAALFVLVFHVASSAASIVPARASIDARTIVAWSLRTGAVAACTVAVWALVAAAVADKSPVSMPFVVVAFALVAAFAWFVRTRSTAS